MPRQFAELEVGDFSDTVIRVQVATHNAQIPWEHPEYYDYPMAQTAYHADCHRLLGVMLNPAQFPPITGNWLVEMGFEVMLIPATDSVIYRLTMPVMTEANEIAESGEAHGYLELASDDASNRGWFVLFRTCNGMQSSAAALLTSRKVYTQADVMMLMFVLGVWPGALPTVDTSLENVDVVAQSSPEGDADEAVDRGVARTVGLPEGRS